MSTRGRQGELSILGGDRRTPQDEIGKARVADFFRMPLGLIFSIELKMKAIHDDVRLKQSVVEIVSKDQRKLSIIMRDADEGVQLKD